MLITVQLPAHACGNTFSGEPDAGKSACPVRRGESGSHREVFALSPTLPLISASLRLCVKIDCLFGSGCAGLGSGSSSPRPPIVKPGKEFISL
jgi:hypothetical protein